MYKKILAFLLAAIMVFSLVACGVNEIDDERDDSSSEVKNVEETKKEESSKSEVVRYTDIENIVFTLPKKISDKMVPYQYSDTDNIGDYYYYDIEYDNVYIMKGDQSELIIIEVGGNGSYDEMPDTAEEYLEYVAEDLEAQGMKVTETIKETDNKFIFKIEMREGYMEVENSGDIEFNGAGYSFYIKENGVYLWGMLISFDDEIPDWFLETIKDVEVVDYSKYKLSKSELNKNLDDLTTVRVTDDFSLNIPSILHENSVNAYSFLEAIDNEVIEYKKEDIYIMVDKESDSFTLGASDMSLVVMLEEDSMYGCDDYNIEMVKDNFSYLFDVSDFKVKEVKSTKTSKIFEVSFKSEDEDMNGNDVEIQYFGHFAVYDMNGVSITVIALYDKEMDWTFDTVKSLKSLW